MNWLFLGALCLVCIGTNAQTTSVPAGRGLDAYWELGPAPAAGQAVLSLNEAVLKNPISETNAILIQQTGTGNQATLQTLSGSGNWVEARQVNTGNVVGAVVAGLGNTVILSQTGLSNQISFGLNGSGNQFSLIQNGGDVATMQNLNQSGTRLELIQGAGNNSFSMDNTTLVKDPFSTGIPALRIEQTGGASVLIQSGRIIGK